MKILILMEVAIVNDSKDKYIYAGIQKEAAFNNIFESAKMSKGIISRATTCKYLRKNKKKVEELENGVCCYELQKEVDGLGDILLFILKIKKSLKRREKDAENRSKLDSAHYTHYFPCRLQ
ncbi:hypothetical protein ACMX8W_10225 [Bacillus subtilis]|uniref:hypothetical protein n=1 Tax=Bacillus TaxID=1386 RepID=UPI00157D269C|nr:hypothetical protein [Bacillus subtilis]MBE1868796.1 hypothetical protein [Bacillus subtilis]MCM3014292.1 hypothetical protein [Bacillus subtilis]NUC10071.1 hypothetical protein [Bacillus subtilis]WMW45228.1 hypothetical protein RFN65_10615 [Bacillus subtilis]